MAVNEIGVGTKTVREVVREELSTFTKEDLMLGVPVEVVDASKYEDTQCVDLIPLISDVYEDGVVLHPQIIRSVFVRLQEAGGFKVKFPVHVGDKGFLQYGRRDLTAFLSGDGSSVEVAIDDQVKLNDCYVELGFGTRSTHQAPNKDNFILEGENTSIVITPEGEISVTTKGNVSVVTEGNATIECSEAKIDSPTTQCTGDLDVLGKITCPTIEAGSSLKAQGVEVYQHDHNGQVPPFQ